MSQDKIIVLEGNGSRPSHQGDGYRVGGAMYTLNTTEVHAVCYGISSMDSNGMKSPNPHSGIYEATTSRTLDNNGGNPACNQGGNDNMPEEIEAIIVEHHPNDSRTKIADDQKNCQGLTSRMGTGGGNVPLIMVKENTNYESETERETHSKPAKST